MVKPFEYDSCSLIDIFSVSGRGFYIPYYQRRYSWTEYNAEQLVDDIFSAIQNTLKKPDHIIFLGTLILHNEENVKIGEHQDTNNLITKIVNIVDGQQRLTTISLLSCVLTHLIKKTISEIDKIEPGEELDNLKIELTDLCPLLQKLYSVKLDKSSADPQIKPIIIRPIRLDTHPRADQWTLKGNSSDYYKSDLANFVSKFIAEQDLSGLRPKDNKMASVVDKLLEKVESETDAVEIDFVKNLQISNEATQGNLENFLTQFPNLSSVSDLDEDQQNLIFKSIYIIAFCRYLLNSCLFVSVETSDLKLALDMFQALNATGTPLTAFEVFKPRMVDVWSSEKYGLDIKPHVDRAEKALESEAVLSDRSQTTIEVTVSFALLFNGSLVPKKFSDCRDFLLTAHGDHATMREKNFIERFADHAEYHNEIIRPRKPPVDSTSSSILHMLGNLGLNTVQANSAATCIHFLKEANHRMSHVVISVFYAKLLRANRAIRNDPDSDTLKDSLRRAAEEFELVCKAVSAFFILWITGQGEKASFPDQVYRDLFIKKGKNISVEDGEKNQTLSFIRNHFVTALSDKKICDLTDFEEAQNAWVAKAKNYVWYQRQRVCRFSLMLAMHDAAPDLNPGKEGLLVDGSTGSHPILTLENWFSKNYEVVEHVATREKPNLIRYPAYFDETLYPGNYSVVDKIGNLTLLSLKINSSLYPEWPDKIFYFWSLTQPQKTIHAPDQEDLMTTLSLTSTPPALYSLTKASVHLPHLAPLAYRGQSAGKWDATFIDQRSENIVGRVFEKLGGWLGSER